MFRPAFSRRFAALALCLWSAVASAQWVDPGLRWRTLQTDNFNVHFPEARVAEARLAAAVAEKVYPRVTRLLRWEPRQRTEVIILDSADFSNGYASPTPFSYTGIWLAPPDEGELLQNREWLELVLTHELFHIVHLDKAAGFPLALRNIFGRALFPVLPAPFTPFPNVMQPRWIIEGLAVYTETDVASGYGRLEHSHYEGMMRAEVARGLRSLQELNADGRGFPLNRNYLYGAYFFTFLRERYGERSVIDYIENYSNDVIPFMVNGNPVPPTGKTLEALWGDFHEWLKARFPAGQDGAQEGEPVAKDFTIFAPALAADGRRWYAQGDGYTLPRLVSAPRGGKAEPVRRIEPDSRVFPLGADGLLVSQLEVCDDYNLFYDLYRIDAGGGRKRLTDCGRYRFAAPLEDGRIAALRVVGGIAEVVMLDARGAVQRSLYRAVPGESVSGLAAGGERVVVTALRSGLWSVVDVGGAEPQVLVSDSAIKHSPRIAGDDVYFIADYGKVYNVWSVKRGSRSVARWTAARNGVKEISAPVDGELLLTTIEADGDVLRLYRLPPAPLEQRYAASIAGLPEVRLEAPLQVADRPYSPWSSLRPRSWTPILAGAEGSLEIGFLLYGHDALGLHEYLIAPRWEVTQGELLASAEYIYDARHGLLFDRSMVVKAQDSDDEIAAYSTKERAQWISLWRHLRLNARFYWGLGAAIEHERIHDVRSRTSGPVQDERVAGIVLGVDTRRQQILSEGPSEGQHLRVFAETSNRLNGDYAGNVYRGDWRLHVPLWRTVLGLRWFEGWGQPNAEPFELGGVRSEEYFTLPVLNQREFSLRGYGSGEPALTGHRARIWTAEWRAPLADIDRHAMNPPVGINRVSMNLFVDVGAAWERGGRPDYHRGVGAELVAEPRVGYLFGLRARAGVAKGMDAPGRTQFYLRVGRSF